jgi:hypothetical protein
VSVLLAAYGRACYCAGIRCSSSPTVSPIKFIKVQITNKCSKEIRQPKPLLIVNKKMKIYSSASIEANRVLPAASCHLDLCLSIYSGNSKIGYIPSSAGSSGCNAVSTYLIFNAKDFSPRIVSSILYKRVVSISLSFIRS